MEFTASDFARQEMFDMNASRLSQLAWRAAHVKNLKPETFFVICIAVDDASWTELVEVLMPGYDWDAIRARGEIPFARGSVARDAVGKYICEVAPVISPAFDRELEENAALAIVCGAGGCSAYIIDMISEE